MGTNSIVSTGDKVVLSRINKSGEEKEYISKVVSYVDDANMKIEMPMENSMYIPLKIGREFFANFQTRTSMYKCRIKVVDRIKENSKYYIIIKFLSDFEKVQRREFYRLECVSDIDICIGSRDSNNAPIWQKAVMIDLSGGGMRFNSKALISKDKRIKVRFPIVLNETKEFLICIVKIVLVKQMTDLKYEYRVIFDELENDVREKIIKHIFEEERRRRRRKNRS